MHLERSHRGHQHYAVGNEPGVAALDVHEFLHAHVCAEARFCDNIVGQLECNLVRDNGGVAVSDICERTGMDKGRLSFERLHQVGHDRVLHQDGCRACYTQIFDCDCFA